MYPEDFGRRLESFESERQQQVAATVAYLDADLGLYLELRCPQCEHKIGVEDWTEETDISFSNIDWKKGIKNVLTEGANLGIPVGECVRSLFGIREKNLKVNTEGFDIPPQRASNEDYIVCLTCESQGAANPKIKVRNLEITHITLSESRAEDIEVDLEELRGTKVRRLYDFTGG